MKRWEIWLASVAYEDNPDVCKLRPVLVTEQQELFIISYKMTSHTPRDNYFGEYLLINWQESGLIKPTTVRLNKILKLKQSDFKKYIGKLTYLDIIEIKKLLDNQ